jgi:hypothetical protein
MKDYSDPNNLVRENYEWRGKCDVNFTLPGSISVDPDGSKSVLCPSGLGICEVQCGLSDCQRLEVNCVDPSQECRLIRTKPESTSGEAACQNHGYDAEQCNAVGKNAAGDVCCVFDSSSNECKVAPEFVDLCLPFDEATTPLIECTKYHTLVEGLREPNGFRPFSKCVPVSMMPLQVGMTEPPKIPGCMDKDALNYDPMAVSRIAMAPPRMC